MDEALAFVDAHHHLWDLEAVHYPWLMTRGERRFFGDPTPIQQNYLVEDFLAESDAFKPVASVHVQVGAAPDQSLRETQWLDQQDEYPHAIVAFCDLAAADAGARLDAQMQYRRVRGIRQIIGRHADEDCKHGTASLPGDPAWLAGLRLLVERGLSFDLQLTPPQLPTMAKLLRELPGLNVALCHCGSPWDQSPAGLERWRADLRGLAALPGVVCKVSGLGMFKPDWSVADLRPIVLDVIDIFSPRRVMFGSNFPVDKLYRCYRDYWRAYADITAGFSMDERNAMFHDTAARFYRL